ncbi:hypothetical protein LCGC14_2717950 [marine sediment metagenome]|uniref:Uncharacterized protein n=1 Tax=marine sediment metagenome TaxID=412755 RepID=A0A0F9C2S2_9ZZZZ
MALNHDYRLAKNAEERILAKAGIPRRFWNVKPDDLEFLQTDYYGVKLSGQGQRQWLRSLLSNKSGRIDRRLIVAGSDPTDEGSLALGCVIVRHFLQPGRPVAIADVQFDIPLLDPFPHVLLLHNVMSGYRVDQLQETRNALRRFGGCLRILAIAGERNPFRFCIVKLGLEPDTVFVIKHIPSRDGR